MKSGGSGADRKSGDDRTGGRVGIFRRRCVVDGTVQESVEHEILDLRIIQRFWRDCSCGAGAVGDRVGYARIDYMSRILVRNLRDAAEFWACEPAWRDGDSVDDGYVGTDGADGG